MLLLWLLSVLLLPVSVAQTTEEPAKEPPPSLQSNRADEGYTHLKNPESNPYQPAFADALKYVAIDSSRSLYFTFGGGYRARVEHFSNKDWTTRNQTYYSQRLSAHAALNLGKKLRIFGELYHGYTSDTLQFLQSDEIDWYQGFVEYQLLTGNDVALSFRFGRQELAFGATRLIGTRDGTNMRRSFDLLKSTFSYRGNTVELFYGAEVDPRFEAFDNAFSLFDSEAANPEIWGAYFRLRDPDDAVNNEVYYIGYRSKSAFFSDVFGEETRHTVGLRRVGKIGQKLSFNTELIYQFGKLGSSNISAFDIETDWKWIFGKAGWRPILGIKLDFSSGDRQSGDDRLQTFNPLFVNPAIYSLAAVNTPANLSSFHPNLTVFPLPGLSIYLDYALFFRTSRADGLYAPPRFQTRPAAGIEERHIGDALGVSIQYKLNRNITFSLMSSYFIPAGFIKASGSAESTFFIAPTINTLF